VEKTQALLRSGRGESPSRNPIKNMSMKKGGQSISEDKQSLTSLAGRGGHCRCRYHMLYGNGEAVVEGEEDI